MPSSLARLASIVLVTLALAGSAGCGKHLYGKDDLDVASGKYYLDMRWGRIAAAAQRVHPDLRETFIEDWQKRAKEVEIHDLEIVETTIDPEGNDATLVIMVNWVDRSSMTMQESTIVQKWQRTDDGWMVAESLKLGE